VAKILIVISSDIYVRNYLRTDALKEVLGAYECDLIADQELALAEEVSQHPNFRGFYLQNRKIDKRHELLFNVMMWRYRKKSPTFRFRWLRNSQWHLVRRNKGLAVFVLSAIRWFFSAMVNPKGFRVVILGSKLIFPVAGWLLGKELEPNQMVFRLLQKEKYRAIIFPSAAFDSISVDLIELAQSESIPTLCLIDNWDNLTSKTVFRRRPDHLGVWGTQAKEQAIAIHGFRDEQVHLIGTPRFDAYFEYRDEKLGASPYGFPYILFTGSAMPFDEIGALRKVESVIYKSPFCPNDLAVIYRPHPWQQKRNTAAEFVESDFSRTFLDLQIAEGYRSGVKPETTVPSFQPDLNYYPTLLRNAALVVGPLTTMLFEASLCLRPVIALSYFDGHHQNTTKRYFSHFQGMQEVPGFSFCESPGELASLIESALSLAKIDRKDSDKKTEYFLHHSSDSYPDRLKALIDYVVEG